MTTDLVPANDNPPKMRLRHVPALVAYCRFVAAVMLFLGLATAIVTLVGAIVSALAAVAFAVLAAGIMIVAGSVVTAQSLAKREPPPFR